MVLDPALDLADENVVAQRVALHQLIAEEEQLAYLLRERRPTRRRIDITRELPPAVSHAGRLQEMNDGASTSTHAELPSTHVPRGTR